MFVYRISGTAVGVNFRGEYIGGSAVWYWAQWVIGLGGVRLAGFNFGVPSALVLRGRIGGVAAVVARSLFYFVVVVLG